MSEAISQPELQAEQPPAEFQRPGSEEFFEGEVPDPHGCGHRRHQSHEWSPL